MDVATARSRPQAPTFSRPTQAYYVPRRVLQCGLPTANTPNNDDKERCVENNNNNNNSSNKDNEMFRESSEKSFQRDEIKSTKDERRTKRTPTNKSPDNKKSVPKPKPVVTRPSQYQRSSASSETSSREVDKADQKSDRRASDLSQNSQKSKKTSSNKNPALARVREPVFNPDAPVLLTKEDVNVCICDRSSAHIVCRRCSYECNGRVQRVCALHPTKMALMDLRECPNTLCRSVQLLELSN